MKIENITEIGITEDNRLYIQPQKTAFNQIYRTASDVYWDSDRRILITPTPKEWSFFQWYCHIITNVDSEYDIRLKTNAETNWLNVTEELKNSILNYEISML